MKRIIMGLKSFVDTEYAYNMGYDSIKNGANTTNCDFRIFGSKEMTAAWERGKRDAESGKV